MEDYISLDGVDGKPNVILSLPSAFHDYAGAIFILSALLPEFGMKKNISNRSETCELATRECRYVSV